MYDENDLYNEVGNTIKSSIHNAKTIYDFIEKMKENPKELLTATNTDFIFTGQSTDLSYFENFNEMPISFIEQIPDENLKNAVKEEFNKATLDGKLEIDLRKGTIKITDKGRKFIEKPEFKKASAINRQSIIADRTQIMGFELNGTVQDLNFFKYSETLDLKEIIKSPDTETVQKVLGNLGKMQESGYITLENSIVKLTNKGKNLLNDNVFKLASQGASEKIMSAVGGVPGKIFVVTKKIIQSTAQNTINSVINRQ